MKQIKVESSRIFDHGFVLNETELRRIVDAIRERIKKVPNASMVGESYVVKFKNGAVAEADNLDTVLEQENAGEASIIRLKLEIRGEVPPNEEYKVACEFINVDADEELGSTSIRFRASGLDRDWVFVTSSELKERIDKIKRTSFSQLGVGKGRFALVRFLFPVVGLLMMAAFLGFAVFALLSIPGQSKPLSESVREFVSSRPDLSVVDVLIKMEQLREERFKGMPTARTNILYYFGLAFGALMMAVFFFGWFYTKYYPAYNFVWGDYVAMFNKIEAGRQFWWVVIAIGLVVSTLGSVLASRLVG